MCQLTLFPSLVSTSFFFFPVILLLLSQRKPSLINSPYKSLPYTWLAFLRSIYFSDLYFPLSTLENILQRDGTPHQHYYKCTHNSTHSLLLKPPFIPLSPKREDVPNFLYFDFVFLKIDLSCCLWRKCNDTSPTELSAEVKILMAVLQKHHLIYIKGHFAWKQFLSCHILYGDLWSYLPKA